MCVYFKIKKRIFEHKIRKLYEIKTYGNIASLIDYGNVVNENEYQAYIIKENCDID